MQHYILRHSKSLDLDQQDVPGYEEQHPAVQNSVNAIKQYVNYTCQSTFVKCRVIAGSPGSGKSFLLTYLSIYAISQGLNIAITSMMSQLSVHLGGTHLHKLFYLPVTKIG